MIELVTVKVRKILQFKLLLFLIQLFKNILFSLESRLFKEFNS